MNDIKTNVALGIGAGALVLSSIVGIWAIPQRNPGPPPVTTTSKATPTVEVRVPAEKPSQGPTSNAVPDNPPDPPPEPLVPDQGTSEARWQPITDEKTLTNYVGDWSDLEHKPTPLVKLQYKREGSKTPFNVQWHVTLNNSGGCGFCLKGMENCEQGIAYCKVHDEDNRKVPKDVKSTVLFEMQGEFLRVTVGDDTPMELRRKR